MLEPAPFRLVLGGVGILLTFFGYSTFRFGLTLTAFAAGATAGLPFLERIPPDPAWLRPVLLAALGLAAAILLLAAWRVGVAVVAMVLLVSLALRMPTLLPAEPTTRLLVLVLVAAAGAVLSRTLERLALTAATAGYGALLLTAAVAGGNPRLPPGPTTIEPRSTAFWLWVGLAACGFLVQNARLARRREARPPD
jgi:hypothetical protein